MLGKSQIKYNRRRRLTKNLLGCKDKEGQIAFENWLAAHRNSKKSQQSDLPSSQIVSKMQVIDANKPQLFAIVDTCSVVSHRTDFIEYVTHLKDTFPGQTCPIKLIISLPVLEELDKCNRPKKLKKDSDSTIPTTTLVTNIIDPPRNFMRFLEEEIRVSDIIISELDPFKKIPLNSKQQTFEIINKDDRILECCLRTQAFLNDNKRHADTKVILISEDNVFKAKATTYQVLSFRWLEFKLKYKNFGHKNYAPTPLFPNGIPTRKRPAKIYDPRWMANPLKFFGPTGSDVETTSIDNNNIDAVEIRKEIVRKEIERRLSASNSDKRIEDKKEENKIDNDDVIIVKEVINI